MYYFTDRPEELVQNTPSCPHFTTRPEKLTQSTPSCSDQGVMVESPALATTVA